MRILFLLFVIAFVNISCGQKNESKRNSNAEDVSSKSPQSNFLKEDIAIYTVSSIMNQPPSIISAELVNEIYNVKYERPSDGQVFEYRIKFEGTNKVIWANKEGRWRDSEYDEKVTYLDNGNKLTITQIFDDGSIVNKVFEKE